jgi:iron complex outermembrane receptor protein
MNKNKMSMAVRSAMGIVAFAGVMATGGAYAQEESAEVEEVVVLGSRIKRTTNTESQTIISITAADMKLTGEVTVADALRSSTLNSLGSFRESSGNSAQSESH